MLFIFGCGRVACLFKNFKMLHHHITVPMNQERSSSSITIHYFQFIQSLGAYSVGCRSLLHSSIGNEWLLNAYSTIMGRRKRNKWLIANKVGQWVWVTPGWPSLRRLCWIQYEEEQKLSVSGFREINGDRSDGNNLSPDRRRNTERSALQWCRT